MKRIALAFMLATAMGCSGSEDPVVPPPPPPTGECNLDTQSGCAEGEKCTWIRQTVGEEPVGLKGCVAEGTAATGDACVWGVAGSTTGFDNCAAGLICSSSSAVDQAEGTCTEICSLDGVSLACPTGFACSRYHGYFANGTEPAAHGQCNPSCDPMTNKSYNAETGEFDIANCGGDVYPDVYPPEHENAGDPVPEAGLPYESCVTSWAREGGPASQASCASNINPLYGHREPAALPAEDRFLNSCPPGTHIFGRGEATEDATCIALCTPADTFVGNVAQARGIAPNSCDDPLPWAVAEIGRAANDSLAGCRYGWWLFERGENQGLSDLSNTVGGCFDASKYLLSDEVTPVPTCETLTDTPVEGSNPEAMRYGCMAFPAAEKVDASKIMRVGSRAPAVQADVAATSVR